MAESIEKAGRTQWHPGFVGGLKISLMKYKDLLEYNPEYQLTKGSLYMDLLVIRKLHEGVIENDIARVFRKHNIVEYKSPGDRLSIDDLYKVISYVGLYKASAEKVNEIPADELTATIIREEKPVAMFQELKRLGAGIEETVKGVFQITGVINFPLQVIVSGDLKGAEFAGLRILSKKPEEKDVETFVQEALNYTNPGDQEDADAVLQVSISQNLELYEQLKRRDPIMCDALRALMKPEIDEELKNAVDQNRIESIKNLMYSLKFTPQQAMDALKIPASEQSKYASKI